MKYCYLNGKIMPESEAKVGIMDIGLLRGYGIYEAMTAVGDKVFMIDDHLARFRDSARFLGIDVAESDDEIKKIISGLIDKNGYAKGKKRSNIKFIMTGGKAVGGIDFEPGHPTFYIFLEEWKALPPEHYTNGATVLVSEYLRHNPTHKTTDYIHAVSLQKLMRASGALEALYLWQGKVLECSTSNVFIVTSGVVMTPNDNVLHGITRNAVIDLIRKNNIPFEECDISESQLYGAQECFITSSFKDVVPVVKVGDRTIGVGEVGQVTKKLMKLFEDLIEKY